MRRTRVALFTGLVLLVLTQLMVEAQSPKPVPRIGVLWPNPPETFEGMRQGLRDLGYVEGRTIAFEYRWAQNKLDEVPQMAADLVAQKVDVIITLAPIATLAARNATQTIPIVFLAIGDPLASGLVTNLARPGGNMTGTTRMLSEMSAKHVEFLKQAVPGLSRLAILWNPNNTSHTPALRNAESTARSLSVRAHPIEVRSPAELDSVFAAIARERDDGLLFLADPIFLIHLGRLAALANAARLPSISNFTEYPRTGGLMGYSPSIPEEFRRAATHVDKILKGANPGDLPIQQPSTFDLVINLKTAKALGLTIPPALLARADHVVE
jgi:putative ABC transport system substrate-binding protein